MLTKYSRVLSEVHAGLNRVTLMPLFFFMGIDHGRRAFSRDMAMVSDCDVKGSDHRVACDGGRSC